MERRVPQSKIEQVLREALGSDDGEASDAEAGRRTLQRLPAGSSWPLHGEPAPQGGLASRWRSASSGCAHQDITATQEFTLRRRRVRGEGRRPPPRRRVCSSSCSRARTSTSSQRPQINRSVARDITGTRADARRLPAPRSPVALSSRVEPGHRPESHLSFPLDEVRWSWRQLRRRPRRSPGTNASPSRLCASSA